MIRQHGRRAGRRCCHSGPAALVGALVGCRRRGNHAVTCDLCEPLFERGSLGSFDEARLTSGILPMISQKKVKAG